MRAAFEEVYEQQSTTECRPIRDTFADVQTVRWKGAGDGDVPPWIHDRNRCYGLSYHAHGIALDISPTYNGRYPHTALTGVVGGFWHNPNWQNPTYCCYALRDTDALVIALRNRGLTWGGNFVRSRDYMHFSWGESDGGDSGYDPETVVRD